MPTSNGYTKPSGKMGDSSKIASNAGGRKFSPSTPTGQTPPTSSTPLPQRKQQAGMR